MAVVENQRLLTRHQTGSLQLREPVQTFLVHFDGETARQ